MPTPKYPLKPVLEHRERAVDDRTAELGGAVGVREAADASKERASAARKSAESEAEAVRDAERSLLKEGTLSVADLARGHAWEIGAQSRIASLANVENVAVEKQSGARSAEAAARDSLAQAMADRDVVAKDEARFVERAKKKQLAAEEEQAEEAYRGGRK
jgi:hypothetical protein